MAIWNPKTKKWDYEESKGIWNPVKRQWENPIEEEEEEEEEKLDFFRKGAFSRDDISGVEKAVLGVGGTGLHVAKNVAEGILTPIEGILDFARHGIADVTDFLGAEKTAQEIRDIANESDMDKLFGWTDDYFEKNSMLGRTTEGVAQGVGQVGSMLLPSALGNALGLGAKGVTALTSGYTFTSSAGSGRSEAYLGGATDEESRTYGAIKGTADATTELLFGGLGKAIGAVGYSTGVTNADDVLAQKLSNKVTDILSKNIKISDKALTVAGNTVELGVKSSAEGLEEVLAGSISAWGKSITYMEETELLELIEDENLLEQFVVGALTSGVVQSGAIPKMREGSYLEANAEGRDMITGYTRNEQNVVDRIVNDRIAEAEKGEKKLTTKEKNNIKKDVATMLERGEIDIETIERTLSSDNYRKYQELEKESQEFNTLYETESGKLSKKQQDRLAELEAKNKTKPYKGLLKETRQQISEEVKASTQKDMFLQRSYLEKSRRSESFKLDETKKYSTKELEVINKAVESKILNNTRKTHEFVDLVAKLSADKGVSFNFTNNQKLKESGFSIEGKTINGFKQGNEVTINIQSQNVLETVVGHEITHVLEGTDLYKTLQDTVIEYAKQKGVYDAKYKDIVHLYKNQFQDNDLSKRQELYKSELTADLVGEYIFTDTDFVRNLSMKDKNMFQKVYDEIKYFLKSVTAGSKEEKQLLKAKKIFEDVYRDTKTNTSEETQLSMSENDTDVDSWLGGLTIDDLIADLIGHDLIHSDSNVVQDEKPKKQRSKRRVDEVNKRLKEIGLSFNGTKSASWTDERIEKYLSGSYYGSSNPKYAQAYITYMTPKQFLDLTVGGNTATLDMIQNESAEYGDIDFEKLGNSVPMFLDIREGKNGAEVVGHEGRHRMYLLGNAGFEKVPVLLFDYRTKYDKSYKETLKLKTQKYGEKHFVSKTRDVVVTDVIPFSQGNHDLIIEKFGSGNKNSDIQYSLSSMGNTFFGDANVTTNDFEITDDDGNLAYKKSEGYKKYVEQAVNNMKQTRTDFDETVARQEIEKQIDGIVRVAIASKRAGYDILDYMEKDGKQIDVKDLKDSKKRLLFSSLEPNSEYFTSSDISTICDKRKNFAQIYDDIVRAEEQKGVPKGKRFFDKVDNYFYIHEVMAKKGLTQPCRQCYVESMRKNLAPMSKAFVDLVTETDVNNKSNKQLYTYSKKDGYNEKSNNMKLREKVLEQLDEYGMSANDLTIEMLSTADGLAQLKIQAPQIYEAFNSFYGQSKPKMPKEATPFRFGELTALLTDENGNIKRSLVEKINSTGGFRLQSYSDFQIQNFTDVLQVIFEAGTLGLNGHAYTKVPAFLDATEGTNLKRNISIFMYKDGSQWKIDRNDSFPYKLEEIYDIVNADNNGNTSIIAVSQNEDMSAWIMANENVGYGIPFHKSGMKMGTVRETDVKTEDGRIVKGYKNTKDHTRQQTEVWARTEDGHKAETKVKQGINIYSFWDFENKARLPKNELIQKNIKAYIDRCEAKGYLPKFREYVMNNAKVLDNVLKYSKEMGYVSQSATIEDISFEYKGYRIPYGYYKFLGDFGMFKPNGEASAQKPLSLNEYNFAKAEEFFANAETLRRNELLQQFANGEERARYRDSDYTNEELENIIRQKRKEVVDEIVPNTQYSLSDQNQIAPRNPNLTYAEDVALEGTQEATEIAPTNSNVQAPIKNVVYDTTDYAPMTEAQVNEFVNSDEEWERMRSLQEVEEPSEIEAPIYEERQANSPFYDRDIQDVGKRNVKAYMYENPEVKPFFQEEARIMLGELKNSIKGERVVNAQVLYDTNGEAGVWGTTRETSEEIAYLLDTFKYTYAQIEKGLNAIIEDDGKENNAVSKRIEFMLDERLRLGHMDFMSGYEVPPNQEYIDTLIEKDISEYSDEAWNEWLRNVAENEYVQEETIESTQETAPIPDAPIESTQLKFDDETGEIVDDIEPENETYRKARKEIREALLEDRGNLAEALDNAKNIPVALLNNTDTIRATELVFGRGNANKINESIFQKAIDNEAESIAWQNKERSDIKKLGIKPRSKESEAVQKYGEKQWEDENGVMHAYGDFELATDFPDVATQNKIKNASRVLREKYDNYIDQANDVLTKLGFEPIHKRADYMRHFEALTDAFSKIGIPFNIQQMQEYDLPTDINGLTDTFTPQKSFFANIMQRKGNKTTLDAITGIDGYIGGISNLIFHTEDIQRGRAFEELIRERYGRSHAEETLKNIASDTERQRRLARIQENHLSGYASWVHDWTNNLAGKKDISDRGFEHRIGRRVYSFFDTLRKQVSANMIGFNISSAMTNMIAPVQAIAKTNKLAFAKGSVDTFRNIFVKDDFVSKNSFLTSRMGTDKLSKNLWEKTQDAGFIFMRGMDYFTSNMIVRSKYHELISKGMTEAQAHKEAGKFAARIMGDRTKGANAQLFNSKFFNMFAQFQLEVNNQVYSMFYDTYHESAEKSNGSVLKASAGMMFTLGQLFGATHLFGKAFEKVAGYNPTLDIIGIIATALGVGDDDEEKPIEDRLEDATLQLLKGLPYVSTFVNGGRIPMASALPITELITGEKDGYEVSRTDTLLGALPYYLMPAGYGQIKKTTQGLGMFDEDLPISGSYTDSGNLRFPVEDTLQNRVKAGVFGQWASGEARDYFDNERLPLKEKQIEEFKELDIPIRDYWEYREGLTKQENTEGKLDYISSLDLPISKKNIMANNVSNRKEPIDMEVYEQVGGLEEYNLFSTNRGQYYISKVVGGYETYSSYKEALGGIEADKNEKGNSISGSRKIKVVQYLNSLEADYYTKIMLFKNEYPSDETYNYEIIEYLNNREDVTYQEMVDILTELDFEVSDDGTIRW